MIVTLAENSPAGRAANEEGGVGIVIMIIHGRATGQAHWRFAHWCDNSRPQRPGFPDRFKTRRFARVDQALGIVDKRPSELRSREVSVERADQAVGREPPSEGSLQRQEGRKDHSRESAARNSVRIRTWIC